MSGEPLADSMNGSMELGVGTFALIDTRDQKDYLVRRLADGNCWMVQNLDLDLNEFLSTETKRLTPENTDVAETWIPDASVNAKIAQYLQEGKISTNSFQAFAEWQLGISGYQTQQFQNSTQFSESWIWASKRTSDSTIGSSFEDNSYAELPRSYDNTVYESTSTGYVAMDISTGKTYRAVNTSSTVSGWTEGNTQNSTALQTTTSGFMPTAKLTTPGTVASGEGATDDDVWNFYGSMYIGKYYNWYAATAETGKWNMGGGGTSMPNNQASGSICPSGWELPYDYGYQAGRNKSWTQLINNAYNISQSAIETGETESSLKARHTPLSLPLSGYYGNNNGSLTSRGVFGRFWSRTRNTVNANYLYFSTDGRLSTNGGNSMSNGLSIRCVSHGTENQVTPPEDVVASTCAANSICYDANGGTGDTMANTSSATFGSSKVLSAPTYTRTGYAFVGWSESKDAVQSGAYIYGPNETITVPNLSSEGMTLYAQWLAPENSSYTMQAFGRNETVKTCATMTDGNNGTTEERIALRDERDDNVYIVTKLKDGNCWMTSNLALNLADFAGKTTGTLLTPENTDLTASREDLSTLTIEGVGGGQQTVKYWDPQESSVQKFVDLGLGTAEQYSFPTLANKLLGQEGQLHQFQSSGESRYLWGSKCTPIYDESNPPKIVNTTCDSSATVLSNILAEIPREYINPTRANFNFYAATAESGKYDIDSGNAPDSICPSGWTLPFYTNAPDDNQTLRQLLVNKYDNSVSKFYSLPLSFTESGFYYHDGKSYLGNGTRIITNAYYGNKGYAYISITNSNAILIDSTYDAKSNGEAIRCIKK